MNTKALSCLYPRLWPLGGLLGLGFLAASHLCCGFFRETIHQTATNVTSAGQLNSFTSKKPLP